MKKYLVLILAILFLSCSTVWAGGIMMMGGGVPVAGGAAASGSYDPVADHAYNGTIYDQSWGTVTSNFYTFIDDGTRSPDSPGTDRLLPTDTPDDSTYFIWKTSAITGTISTVRLYVFGRKEATANRIRVAVSNDGTNFSDVQEFSAFNTGEWAYKDFTVTYATGSVVYVKTSCGADGGGWTNSTYITVNP